ncbi:MAG: hypothetical protein E7C95_03445 [Anaerococcus prevotii]|uniref:hypothetical protein n=1 Tax=Anaerococcus prevotii TaxID=33034 RepID=UPI002900A214|nr:hypothetical protein [Anaerococcus prevotii]MDU2558012.1 hypothetical protein [Anaerococcus prevotii]
MENTDYKIYKVKILDIKDEFKNVKTYTLEKPEGLSWEEGSSFHLAIPGFNEGGEVNKKLVHHLSINTLTDDDTVNFTTKFSIRKSDFKKALLEKEVGDYLEFFKVRCHMKLRRENRPIVLLSMGIGLTTMRPLINKFKKDPSSIPELLSINVARKDNHLFESEISKVDDKIFRQVWVDSRANFFETLREMEAKDSIFYVVGSNEFLLDNIVTLRELGVDDKDIMIDLNDKKRATMFMAANNHEFL